MEAAPKKAAAHCRNLPSEPEASDLALRLRKEAVRKAVEENGLTIVGEFTEREGGDESYAAAASAKTPRRRSC